MFKFIGGGAVLIIAALVLYVLFRGDDEVSAESAYDGVHLCAPSQQDAATAQARVSTPQAEPPDGGEGPYFAQIDPAWGGNEYDHASSQDVGCGQTIAQCGCAMTSVATVMQLFEVLTTPDGTDLNPATLNNWFDRDAQLTSGGWVSQGFVFGLVVWPAINGWTPESLKEPVSTERDPALSDTGATDGRHQGIRFAGWGTGKESEIKSQLAAGNLEVIEVPGHYVAAVGVEGDQVMINDPYYRDRTTLDSYEGRVISSRIFEPSDDFRMIMVNVPANQRVEVRDEQGRVVGTLGGDDPAAAQENAKSDIPGSQYHYEEAWRDPTCTERPPPPGAGVNTVFIPLPESGVYHVVVIDPDGGETAAGVHTSDIDGNQTTEAHEGGDRLEFDIDYDSGTDTEPTPTNTPTLTPTPTLTATPEVPTVTISPTPTDTPTPTLTPTPTETPTVTITITDGEGSKYRWGESFEVCYKASRDMAITLDAISPEGNATTLAKGAAGVNNTCVNITIEQNDLLGRWDLKLTGEGGATDTTFFEVLPPLMHIEYFSATYSCSLGVQLSWLVTGDPQGTVVITRLEGDATQPVTVYSGEPGMGVGTETTISDPGLMVGDYTYTLTATNRVGEKVSQTAMTSVYVCIF